MVEHRDVRVRAGPLGARGAGKFRQHDVAETGVRGAMGLANFAETKVARSPQASGTATWVSRIKTLDPGLRRDDEQKMEPALSLTKSRYDERTGRTCRPWPVSSGE
jgi:hypothetical protein